MPIPEQFANKLSLPAIAAPMFLASNPELVIETCKAGVIGTFPSLNQRDAAGFESWLITIKEALSKHETDTGKPAAPFGVNLIVMPSPRLDEDLALCVKHEVPLVITSLGVDPKLVEKIHAYGGIVFHDVVKGRHARKAASIGVDGIIAVAAGAGGHAGVINPMALIAEIRSFFDKTIILAGSISKGNDLVAAQALGADLSTMGTRFIATKEASVQDEYKNMITEAKADAITYTPKISGMPANFMAASLERVGMDKIGNVPEDADPNVERNAWKDVWSAGHGVSAIDDVPSVKALIEQLKKEYMCALENLNIDSQRYV